MKALLYLFSGPALAQTLTPVQPTSGGINWTMLAIIGAALVLIGGFVWLKHKNPAAAAQAQATASADVQTVATALHGWAKTVEARFGSAGAAPAPGEHGSDPDPAPPNPGKSGQPGTFTIQVNGDPTSDMPSIIAQYYAK